MAASVISISSDLSDESVESSIPRVILIGSISVEVPVAPEVGAAAVALPAGLRKLDTHSSSEADPSKSSLPPVSVAPMVSPFLCSDDSESRVASRSSSPTTSTSEIPTAPIPPAPSAVVAPSTDIISPVDAPLEIRRQRAILILPGQDIPISRLYRTHPGGPCRALIARKSVRPLPSHHLALSFKFIFCRPSTLGHSLFGHTPPVTTIADSSVPSRFVYLPLARTSRYSEAYRRWRSALLSTMYLPTTSEPSVGDSSSESSAGPSRKRCRDSISPKDSVEEDTDADVLADIEVDTTVIVVAADMDVEAGLDAGIGMEVDVGVDVEDEVEGEVDSSDRGTMKVGVDVVDGIDILDEEIEIGQRELEARSLIASGERDGLLDRVASLERSNARLQSTLRMATAKALDAYEANRAAELAIESQSQNRDDDDNGNVRGNGNGNGGGNGDGNGGGNGNGNGGGNVNRNPNRNDKGTKD
ncbi:hypothetical protein Tco_0377180 [Tanacetum coccineum]